MTTIQHTPSTTVRTLLKAIDEGDADAVVALMAADIRFRFGNAPPTSGKVAFAANVKAFAASIRSVRHELHNIWELDPDVVVCEMDVHYERLDGRGLTLPCCNVFRVRNEMVHEYQIYMDINPVMVV